MMIRAGVVFLILCFFGVASAWADQGADLFRKLGCSTCHQAEAPKSFPSIQEMAQAYEGKGNRLVKFLKGAADPIVRPESSATMKRYIDKTKKLADEERKSLADFIMGEKS